MCPSAAPPGLAGRGSRVDSRYSLPRSASYILSHDGCYYVPSLVHTVHGLFLPGGQCAIHSTSRYIFNLVVSEYTFGGRFFLPCFFRGLEQKPRRQAGRQKCALKAKVDLEVGGMRSLYQQILSCVVKRQHGSRPQEG